MVTTDKGKETGTSPRAAVRAVVRDPELLDRVPVEVLASSGMTAVAACLESLAKGRPDVKATAVRGLTELWSVLPELLTQPTNLELRLRALEGAALAGSALGAAGPGPAQLVAEDLGARHRCDHGALLACLLPRVVQPLDTIPALSGDNVAGIVMEFAKGLGLPVELAQVCPHPDVDELVARVGQRQDLLEHINVEQLKPLLGAAA
jgi:alcohol dehydrogenase class IV